jgi:hypothetical protein
MHNDRSAIDASDIRPETGIRIVSLLVPARIDFPLLLDLILEALEVGCFDGILTVGVHAPCHEDNRSDD